MRSSSIELDAPFFLRSRDSWQNPWPAYTRLRDESPALKVTQDDDIDFWVLSRFADVFAAARDTSTFSSAQGLVPTADAMAGFGDEVVPIVMMDPPDHTAMRRLVSRPLTPRRVAAFEAEMRTFVDEHLDPLADAGEGDIIELLFKPLPSFVVRHYLGVPDGDRVRFDRWTEAIVNANAEEDLGSGQDAMMELFAFAVELIERRKSEPGEDLVSDLVAAGEDIATPMWIVGFIFTMITGGNDTMVGMLGGAAELLTTSRDQRQVLLDDPGLIDGSIDEFLRLTSPVQNLARTTTSPVTLHGEDIPEGAKVMLLYGSANLDEREFGPTAHELDVRRPIDKMLAFSYGAHHCLGAAAARLQGKVALEQMLARFPQFEVDVEAGRFAAGPMVRRYESLPIRT